MKILVVEDNKDIANILFDYFEAKDDSLDWAQSGESALTLLNQNHFDVVILDLSLPDIDGLTVCRRARQELKLETPILMLTARDTLEDKVTGLECGADDYVVKPFQLAEIHARLSALTRRPKLDIDKTYQVADLTYNTSTYTVTRADQIIPLTRIQRKLLQTLLQQSPNVVSKQTLLEAGWGDDIPDSNVLRTHMHALRQLVDKPFQQELIHTIHGVGFCISDQHEDA